MKQDRHISARTVPYSLLSLLALAGFADAQNQTINGDLTVTSGFKTGTSGTGGGMEHRLGGLMISKGTFNNSPLLAPADQGVGTRLLWHPRKAAFRAGYVSGNHWDEANIGNYSTALGLGGLASGQNSTVIGSGSAVGGYATAIGGGYASGVHSLAVGYEAEAIGNASVSLGAYTMATGGASLALGNLTTASGHHSTAMGMYSLATGQYSTAMGQNTMATAISSFALGRFNIGGGNPTNWIPTDPLFEIGNGTNSVSRSNAVTVYKNGNMDVQGAITCAPGGDIPMFGE